MADLLDPLGAARRNAAQLTFTVPFGPMQHGDGSFEFQVAVIQKPAIEGGVPDIVATAEIRVKSHVACAALAQAIANVSAQLPRVERPQ